jgi:hypothetical protein
MRPRSGIWPEHLDKYAAGVEHIAMIRHSPEESGAFNQRFQSAGFELSMRGHSARRSTSTSRSSPTTNSVSASGSGHPIEITPVREYPPAADH